jgi:hypothetical protein
MTRAAWAVVATNKMVEIARANLKMARAFIVRWRVCPVLVCSLPGRKRTPKVPVSPRRRASAWLLLAINFDSPKEG